MATNKHAIIRYQALDKCFMNHHKRFDIESLISACNNAIYEYTGIYEGVKRRQVYLDITFMESDQGWAIPLERIKDGRTVYFRYSKKGYSINNQPLTDSEMSQLRETILMLGRFKGMPQFEWIEELISKLEMKFRLKGENKCFIGFDQNLDLVGLSYISEIFNAAINKQVLEIEYQGFGKPIVKWLIHPYYIKQFNNRWFLFGLNDEFECLSNIPLDRIVSICISNKVYIDNVDIDFEEYFDDVIGVTISPEGEIEKVLLQFSQERFPYVESKPLHLSQKIKNREMGIVEISVILNKELESLILSYGNDLVVLSPLILRERIKLQIEQLNNKYNSVHIDCTNK